ncbi:hypothetical protein NDU88_007308 [Pleurodeles waltl]|uniref:Uncharacterized protein n=1 Tax=Pleurodeles waltl TaxID=8319 RepID=A0AAV7LRP9_PLEWA|nr:hypothetical protein NDU88_007308 [Pleurodeles waltl]
MRRALPAELPGRFPCPKGGGYVLVLRPVGTGVFPTVGFSSGSREALGPVWAVLVGGGGKPGVLFPGREGAAREAPSPPPGSCLRMGAMLLRGRLLPH